MIPVRPLADNVGVDSQRVLDAYKTLHAAGILHRDLEPRHVRIDREGGIRLIDFEGADFVGVGAGEIEDEEAELRELLAF
jgi:serine/threonine protein kinase